jgi:ATP-dependent protease ClpP protease subunit
VHRKVAAGIAGVNEEMARFCSGRLGGSLADFRAVMAQARLITPTAALQLGLIHAVLDPTGLGPLAPAARR